MRSRQAIKNYGAAVCGRPTGRVRPCPLVAWMTCALQTIEFNWGRRIDEAKRCPTLEAYRTYLPRDKPGAFAVTKRDKPPRRIHHTPVIRPDLELLDDRTPVPLDHLRAPSRQARRTRRPSTKTPEQQAFPPSAPIPAWARTTRKGRGGRAAVCRRGRARFARRIFAHRSARRRGVALTARAAERGGLRQNPAPQHRRSRAA
jgi:hypothetical protein